MIRIMGKTEEKMMQNCSNPTKKFMKQFITE